MKEIDVSDCCYYNGDNSPFCCELYDNECEAQNCYYKQLQQYKQLCAQKTVDNFDLIKENEELKENYRLSCLKCKFKNAFMVLDEIEEIASTLECDCAIRDILQKIKEVKGE